MQLYVVILLGAMAQCNFMWQMKLKDEEEEVFAVRRIESNEVVNGFSCNNKVEQERGRVAWGDENTKQDSITCQDGGVVDADDGKCMSTEKMTVVNPGAADSTPYALR